MNPRSFRILIEFALLIAVAPAGKIMGQVVPTTPTKFGTRTISGGGSTGSASVGLAPTKPQTTVRTTTYIALGEARQWKSTDGKSLLGKLIAFEDMVVETKVENGAKPAPAPAPAMPDKPTVVRKGKARLLVDNKPFEVPLERLSEDDRKLVEGIQEAVAAKAPAKP
jgi:hypothetical protein